MLLSLLLATASMPALAQGFFKRLEKPTTAQIVADNSVTEKSEWRPVVTLPALKLVETNREDAKVDALLLTSTGGGISWQKLKYDEEDEKWKSTFSVSPITILLSGNLSADTPIDISYAATVGFFNNLIMVGGGYDLGSVSGRSRFFGLISIGINFNN